MTDGILRRCKFMHGNRWIVQVTGNHLPGELVTVSANGQTEFITLGSKVSIRQNGWPLRGCFAVQKISPVVVEESLEKALRESHARLVKESDKVGEMDRLKERYKHICRVDGVAAPERSEGG